MTIFLFALGFGIGFIAGALAIAYLYEKYFDIKKKRF